MFYAYLRNQFLQFYVVMSTFCHFLSLLGNHNPRITNTSLSRSEWGMRTLELLLTSSSAVLLMLVIYAFGQMSNSL